MLASVKVRKEFQVGGRSTFWQVEAACVGEGLPPTWWDKLCLPPGQPWEQGFADDLRSSDVFVSVLSKAALAPFAQLTAACLMAWD
jgi:hypothetical protein